MFRAIQQIQQNRSLAPATRLSLSLLSSGGLLFALATAASAQLPAPVPSQEFPGTVAPTGTLQVSPTELQQLAYTVRAMEGLGLNPARADEIRRLGPALSQIRLADPDATRYVIPAEQAQSLQSLLASLAPTERTALNVLLLSGLPPSNLQLSRQDLEAFLEVAQQQPPTSLTARRQDEIRAIAEAAPTPDALVPATDSRAVLSAVSAAYNLGRFPVEELAAAPGRQVTSEELQATLADLSKREQSASDLEKPAISSLLLSLSSLKPDRDGNFTIPPASDRQLQQLDTQIAGSSLTGRRRRRAERQFVRDNGGSTLVPSISVLNPIGFGGSFGTISVGATFVDPARFSSTGAEDGSAGVTFSLGNPQKFVGIDVTYTAFSVTGENNSDPFETGSFGLQLSRQLSRNSSVGLGVENLITYPEGSNDSGTSTFVVGSGFWALRDNPRKPFGRVFVSGGFGNGRFRSPEDFDAVQDGGIDDFRPFASVALQVVPRVHAIVEWTGQDVSAGLSVVPLRRIPLVLTVAGIDLTGNAEEEFQTPFNADNPAFDGDPRFSAAFSYVFFF